MSDTLRSRAIQFVEALAAKHPRVDCAKLREVLMRGRPDEFSDQRAYLVYRQAVDQVIERRFPRPAPQEGLFGEGAR